MYVCVCSFVCDFYDTETHTLTVPASLKTEKTEKTAHVCMSLVNPKVIRHLNRRVGVCVCLCMCFYTGDFDMIGGVGGVIIIAVVLNQTYVRGLTLKNDA